MAAVALFTSREMRFGQIATLRYPARIELTPNITRGATHWFPPEYWPLVCQRDPDRLSNFGLLIRHPVRRAVRDAVTRHPSTFEFWTQNANDGRWLKWLFASVEWMTDGRLLYGVAQAVAEADAVSVTVRGESFPITLGGFWLADEGPLGD